MTNFSGDLWFQQVQRARHEARLTNQGMFVRFNDDAPSLSQYGRFSADYLDQVSRDVQLVYDTANILVLVTPIGKCEIIRAGINVSDDVINCGLPGPRSLPRGWDQREREQQELTFTATPDPPTTELWWQREKRKYAEKVDVVVALRNDIRSLLGM